MKAYGHQRFDKIECTYGCCTAKGGKKLMHRARFDRMKRKTARQTGRKFVCDEIRP